MPTDFIESGKREISMCEKNVNQSPLQRAPTEDRTCNLGMCPDQESNPQPFGVQNDATAKWATLAGVQITNSNFSLCLLTI